MESGSILFADFHCSLEYKKFKKRHISQLGKDRGEKNTLRQTPYHVAFRLILPPGSSDDRSNTNQTDEQKVRKEHIFIF